MKTVKYYAILKYKIRINYIEQRKQKQTETAFIVFLQRKQQSKTCYTLKSNNVQHSQTLILYNK